MNNELFKRGLLTERDVRHRMGEVLAAVQAAYRVDAHRIAAIFQEAS